MMQTQTTAKKRYLVLTVIGLSLFLVGYLIGGKGFTKVNAQSVMVLDPTSTINNSTLLSEVKSILDTKFINWKASSTPPTEKEKEYGMIKGYVESYKDPYTVFFPPVQAKSFAQNVKGSFGGVGMQVSEKDGRVVVIAPLKDSPAMKAGIKAGDLIATIDGKDTSSMSSEEAVSLIRGDIGTDVKIGVLHIGAKSVVEVKITRQEIKIPTIDTEKKEGVFIIHLYNFSAESPALFEKAIREFATSNLPFLIVDLRGNPGGYLEAAVNMASFFLPEGKVIVSEKHGDGKDEPTHRSKGFNLFNDKLKMVILVDGGSASASEIFAGALKDHGIAKVVGEKSFGKGSVQELINLSDGSSIKVTIAKWYTPNGISISEHGIVPDVEAKLDVKLFTDKKIDTQLKMAIDVVRGKVTKTPVAATSTKK
jgi:carboxyl-terminal processing protease